ncbi:hypothetical protein [Nitrosopumilus piranensis]|uniref:Uncharacterized protein n=1 Tax=Nitrosopumilus piranensis TaxID=1582439 RepID=A0A0C5C7M9_9ARCH|nr:hypothetical protein [Nitrosopumilus piranensis]AJM91257.1 hypothetical protein NPIRD3C_0033 [Nitrosopumilus piranensis]
MKFSLIKTLFQNRKKSLFRNEGSFNLIKYFVKLKLGEISGDIYKFENKEKIDFDESLCEATNQWLDKSIKNMLMKINLNNTIIFDEEKGYENVGTGFIFVPFLFNKVIAFTQKEAYVYFKIDEKKSYTLKINCISIPKTKVCVKINNIVIDAFNINSLSVLEKNVKIKSDLVEDKILKIAIIVEKCWSPNYIFEEIPNYPLGIGIEKIEIS